MEGFVRSFCQPKPNLWRGARVQSCGTTLGPSARLVAWRASPFPPLSANRIWIWMGRFEKNIPKCNPFPPLAGRCRTVTCGRSAPRRVQYRSARQRRRWGPCVSHANQTNTITIHPASQHPLSLYIIWKCAFGLSTSNRTSSICGQNLLGNSKT